MINPVSTESLIIVIIIEMRYSALNYNIEKLGLYHTPAPRIVKAYLKGALHDATVRKYTYRISQKSHQYVALVSDMLKRLGFNAWTYKEGRKRDVFVVEFSKKILDGVEILTSEDKIAYIRGYFDAEGGIPKDLSTRYYIYFAQKNLSDLEEVKTYLEELGLTCGRIHNPSRRVDPDYYRFYILSDSWSKFGSVIGSWHPEKSNYLRMKI